MVLVCQDPHADISGIETGPGNCADLLRDERWKEFSDGRVEHSLKMLGIK